MGAFPYGSETRKDEFFRFWKRAIFSNVKEDGGLRGEEYLAPARAGVRIDAEIAKKGCFRAETSRRLRKAI